MAKNYTFTEAVKIINEGTDFEAITDIGRRYPILLNKVTKVATKAGDDFVDLMNYMPDYLTANKVNSALKAGVGEATTTSDETDDSDEKDANENSKEIEEATSNDTNYESMSAKVLWDMLGKAGKRKLAKSTKKADLVEACKKAFGENTEDADDEAEDTAEKNPYEGKSAMELFKECKKRGLKAAPKKPAKFYADLLIKADTEAAEDSESDDWGDDETENSAKKAENKETSKKSAKSAKKEEITDDYDDWDI